MGLVAAEEEARLHAESAGAEESSDSRETNGGEPHGQTARQDSSSDGASLDEGAPSSPGEALARHLNGLKIEVEAGNGMAGAQNGQGHVGPQQQPLPMGYGQYANGNMQGGQYQGGQFRGDVSPDSYGSMHMMPITLVIPPSPAETLHLPMTLSSPLNLDPNAREFTPSPSPSPSGVVGLPMPPPFSMGPAYDPSFMYGPPPDMGHPMYAPNGEFTGQFYNQNQYSPGSNSPSPTSWENRPMQDADPSRGFGSMQTSPPGREHVSRALLISGVDPSVDDGLLREELAQWGPVRALGLERKHEGLVTVDYFDLRHAKEALHEIQQQHLKHQREMQEMLQQGPAAEKGRRPGSKKGRSPSKQSSGEEAELRNGVRGLVSGRAVWAQYTLPMGSGAGQDAHNQGTLVVFNLDLDMPVEELRKAFETYGDVKELRETPSKRQHKFVEFFDVRAAARALQSLDGTELGGKHVKIEFSRPGGQARRAQAARSQPGPPNFAPPNPGNSVSPPGPPPVFNVMGWDRAMQSNGGRFGPQNGGGGMAPPLFMFLPAFPGGQMDPGGPLMPGLHFPGGGPFPMPFPPMFPPLGYADHMGRFPGFPRGPHVSGAPDVQGFRGRAMDPKRKGKGFHENREEDHMHAGPLRRPKDGPRDGARAQYTFSEFEAELQRENPRTTLMIKNIPNKYSQAMLLALLDAHCVRCNSKIPPGSNEPLSAYDFVYLPIDFKNRCNLGYAFVNFTSAQATLNLYKEFHAQQWEAFNSRKVCQVTYARVQGRKALEDHFRNSRFACDTDEYLPLVFNPPRDGAMCSPPIVAAGHLAGKIASCAGAVSSVAQAHGIEGGGLKGPRIGLVQH